MDKVARKKLNLAVLQRHDPAIVDILDQSAHAVVYKFSPDKQSWERLGYEGVVFVTQRRRAPYFGLYILNRQTIENYSLLLSDFEEIKLTDDFIIYQTNEGQACALWLFEEKDRERMLKVMTKLHDGIKNMPLEREQTQTIHATTVEPSSSSTTATTTTTTASAPSVSAPLGKLNLLQMLQQATVQPSPKGPENAPSQPVPALSAPSPPHNQGDLLKILQQGMAGSSMPPMPPPPPPPPAAMAEQNGHKLLELLKRTTIQPTPPTEPPLQYPSSPAAPMYGARPLGTELTKPFQPPYPAPMRAGSPRNPAALLQTLQGGSTPSRSPKLDPGAALISMLSRSTPPDHAPALTSQEAVHCSAREMETRLGKQPAVVSKAEFIHQFLNMVQHDASFLDNLYEHYKSSQSLPCAPDRSMPVNGYRHGPAQPYPR
ncbi:uncharacterized protein BYT42DRAFT_590160 [Radiomyces spectabilis]|uniref:uncharacterized protein n=1 Tax=Radiomyces spectabilis TaxID=64574 RepID=UPI0022204E2E|nr:uncharacterized protein BYT42DRAFT_590160 [Radiomyces spectabilis]KAI8364724.1 hypothetical protein BYT42DRAFT_590160 [Radiomyces spectabilis]